MEKNVGGLDRAIRVVFGPMLLATAIRALLGSNDLKPSVTAGAAAVGAYLTGTGLSGTCPANSAIGRNTARQGDLTEEAQEVRNRAIQ